MTRTEFTAPPLKHFGNLVMMAAAFVGLGLFMLYPAAGYEKESLYLGVLLAMLLFTIVSFARMPYRITLRDGRMELKSLVRTAEVAPEEITGISSQSFGYYVHINTRQGTFVVLRSFDGLRELVAWIVERNPAVTVAGRF